MTFRNSVFPEIVSQQAIGGQGWSTGLVPYGSGNEVRNQDWEQSRGKYEVSHAIRLPPAYKLVRNHFMAVHGMSDSFPFKDWLDFEVASGEGFFTTLTATTFQMVKRYTSGSATHDRNIYLPKSGTVTVTGGSSPSVNYATGVVTVSSGTPTSWVGEFYVPARYDTDQMTPKTVDRSGGQLVVSWESIPIVETRDFS